MAEASGQNVDLTSDYMAVMSNSMSEEDFAKLQENGYQVGSTQAETAVTIVDHIKASMLEAGCIHIRLYRYIGYGYTDGDHGRCRAGQELNEAFSEAGVPLTEETAREAMEALDEAQALKTPGEDAMKYMVLHKKDPVIESYYTAQYSSLGDGEQTGQRDIIRMRPVI